MRELSKEKTDRLFAVITSNGCREMEETRFHQAVNEVLAGESNKIVLTAYQIFEMANYAGLKVGMPDVDYKNIEYLLDDKMKIFINDEDKIYEGLGILTVEYPDEYALPLERQREV